MFPTLYRSRESSNPRRHLKDVVFLALSFWLSALSPGAAPPAAPPPHFQIDDSPPDRGARLATSFAPIIKRVVPSVVSIFTTRNVVNPGLDEGFPFFDDPVFRRWFGAGPEDRPATRPHPQFRKERGLGSGVVVTPDGYILTNNHVVEGADEIKIGLAANPQQYTARVIGRDPLTDVALLKIEATDLPVITLTDSDLVEVGDVVLAVGNPFGVGQSVSHGIISALGRGGLGLEAYEDFIQTDAPINPGNSGGPLVDAQGRLVGLNTAIASRTGANAGVGFAVPARMVRGVTEKLLQDGKVVRGFLGIRIQELTPVLAREFEAPSARGALVGQVDDKGPAVAAGLKAGDIIVEFNGQAIADSRQLRLLVARATPGTKAMVKVLRQGKSKVFNVTIGEMPAPEMTRVEPVSEEPGSEVLNSVAVVDLTPAARRQYEIPAEVAGVLVTEVAPDSAAGEAGLRVGDVIQEVNRKSIHTADDAVKAAHNATRKRTLLRVWSQGGSRFLLVDESQEK